MYYMLEKIQSLYNNSYIIWMWHIVINKITRKETQLQRSMKRAMLEREINIDQRVDLGKK